MARKDFKKLSQEVTSIQPRAAIPQVDPEAPKLTSALPVAPDQSTATPKRIEPEPQASAAVTVEPSPPTERPIYLTTVDTSEQPTNRGFAMYPSRHTQVVRDLSYIENRRPWQIIDDALEEYVVKHYGKDHRRRKSSAE